MVLSVQKVTGFADSTGSFAYNKQLSKKRALSVAALVNQTIFRQPLTLKGKNLSRMPICRKTERLKLWQP